MVENYKRRKAASNVTVGGSVMSTILTPGAHRQNKDAIGKNIWTIQTLEMI